MFFLFLPKILMPPAGPRQELLLEFYSPMCGHCTHFAPSYAQIAQQLGKNGDAVAARMDLYHYEVPMGEVFD